MGRRPASMAGLPQDKNQCDCAHAALLKRALFKHHRKPSLLDSKKHTLGRSRTFPVFLDHDHIKDTLGTPLHPGIILNANPCTRLLQLHPTLSGPPNVQVGQTKIAKEMNFAPACRNTNSTYTVHPSLPHKN
eukprot:4756983-Amphidinium_carterae.4